MSAIHDVVPGSVIDCTAARDIQVTGELRVHDGQFALIGKSLTLSGKLVADCPQGFGPIGFAVRVVETITQPASQGGKLTARCGEGGGRIDLEAGGAITLAGLGIDANGTAADAAGGTVHLASDGAVTIAAAVTADASGGAARGGTIEIQGTTITVQAAVSVQGYGAGTLEAPGGTIGLDAEDDVVIASGTGLDARTAKGSGGEIEIEAGDLVDVDSPLRAQGTSGSAGLGGTIEVVGARVAIDHDVNASGGHEGGAIAVTAHGGGITIGTGTQATELDVTGASGERGGQITVDARGSHVLLGPRTKLLATGDGEGGTIGVSGIDVESDAGAILKANGASPNEEGLIEVTARGALTLAGTVEANYDGTLEFWYRTGTPAIDSGITGYTLTELTTLDAPCGDGIRLSGTEACDGGDLGDATCASLALGTGVLACTAQCAFDTAGCSGS